MHAQQFLNNMNYKTNASGWGIATSEDNWCNRKQFICPVRGKNEQGEILSVFRKSGFALSVMDNGDDCTVSRTAAVYRKGLRYLQTDANSVRQWLPKEVAYIKAIN